MKVLPGIDDVERIAATGSYKVLPVSCEILSDFTTPIESVEDSEEFKDTDLMLFDRVIAFDHIRQKMILIVNMPLSDVEVGYSKALMELKQLVRLLRQGEKKQNTISVKAIFFKSCCPTSCPLPLKAVC